MQVLVGASQVGVPGCVTCSVSISCATHWDKCHAGVASDAVKVAEYRSILRLRSSMLQAGSWNGLEDEAAYKNFSRILSKVQQVHCMCQALVW